jgi:C-terminal processing protease CtpA/Prc
MQILCSRKEDGNYHLRYWENHTFRPFVRNFFSGDLYLIIGGPTFSAASLFCNTLKGQKNITLIGEETGGGQYSNNGLLLPSVVLPNTGVRIRLPLFRMVPDKNAHPTGRGVMPDIYVGPTAESVRNGLDLKMEKTKELISGHLTRKGS